MKEKQGPAYGFKRIVLWFVLVVDDVATNALGVPGGREVRRFAVPAPMGEPPFTRGDTIEEQRGNITVRWHVLEVMC